MKHGIHPLEKEGKININIIKKGSSIYIRVKDNGVGMSEKKLNNLFSNKGDRIGLKNIRDRINTLYGKKAELKIDSKLNKGTEVEIKLPLISVSEGKLSG